MKRPRDALTRSLERYAGLRLSTFGPFELERFMGATSITCGRLTVGWSRYDHPKPFSVIAYSRRFVRFRWLTFRFYVAIHPPTLREPAAWGSDLWSNPRDPYQ